MATFTYSAFTAKQGLLVGNGGGWTCTGFGSPCSQDASGGPITATVPAGISNADAAASGMYLQANIDLAANEFVGATSMSYIINWHAVATSNGGNPSEIIIWTRAGDLPSDGFSDSILYTNDGISVTHSGTYGSRPRSIKLALLADIGKLDGAKVTLTISGLSFELHDVVNGATSANVTSVSSSAAGSSASSLSSTSSSTTLTTSSTTFLSSSTSTTAISGQVTVLQILPSQSLSVSESQSNLSTPSNSSNKTSLTATERAGVIIGSLLGVALILIAIAFWYQWWQRRRSLRLEEALYDDGQSETYPEARTANREPWTPYSYPKQPYSRSTIADASVVRNEYQETEFSEMELVQARGQQLHNRWQREGDGSSMLASSYPFPTYNQPNTR